MKELKFLFLKQIEENQKKSDISIQELEARNAELEKLRHEVCHNYSQFLIGVLVSCLISCCDFSCRKIKIMSKNWTNKNRKEIICRKLVFFFIFEIVVVFCEKENEENRKKLKKLEKKSTTTIQKLKRNISELEKLKAEVCLNKNKQKKL